MLLVNTSNVTSANAEQSGDGRLRRAAYKGYYKGLLPFSYLRPVVVRAFVMTAPRHLVLHVLGVCTAVQMARVATRRVVARMQRMELTERTMSQFAGHAARLLYFAVKTYDAVPAPRAATQPGPASIRAAAAVHACPELFNVHRTLIGSKARAKAGFWLVLPPNYFDSVI